MQAYNTRQSLVIAAVLVPVVMILAPTVRHVWCAPPLFLAVAIVVFAVFQKMMDHNLRGFRTPQKLPIVGHSISLSAPRDLLFKKIRAMRKEQGSRYSINVLNEYSVNVSDPDAVQAVLSCTKNISKAFLYNLLRPWLGNGLLTSTGQHWFDHRKLLTPAFHFSILDKLAPQVQRHAEKFAEKLEDLMQKDTVGSVDLMPPITRTTLATILEVAMGVDLETAGDEYVEAIHTIGSLMADRTSRFWLWNDFLYSFLPKGKRHNKCVNLLHAYSYKVIAERKASLESNLNDVPSKDGSDETGIRRKLAFLDVLLTAQRNGAQLTDEDIRSEVDTFMFEGHDTTAMAIFWTFQLIANHPEIQELLRKEVTSVELKDALKLPYLDRVIREALRLYPSVPFIGREVTHPLRIGENQVLRPTMSVHVHIYDLHRDENLFPDPLKFDPDREYPKHPFAYAPFSGGSRNCIGRKLATMEMKLVVAATLRSLRLGKPSVPHDQIPIQADLVLRPGISVKVPLESLKA